MNGGITYGRDLTRLQKVYYSYVKAKILRRTPFFDLGGCLPNFTCIIFFIKGFPDRCPPSNLHSQNKHSTTMTLTMAIQPNYAAHNSTRRYRNKIHTAISSYTVLSTIMAANFVSLSSNITHNHQCSSSLCHQNALLR